MKFPIDISRDVFKIVIRRDARLTRPQSLSLSAIVYQICNVICIWQTKVEAAMQSLGGPVGKVMLLVNVASKL